MQAVLKQVIVMRKDLNMRKGKMIAQACHGATQQVLFMATADDKQRSVLLAWLDADYKKIVVSVDSLDELWGIRKAVEHTDIPMYWVEDNGLTEFNGVRTPTCLVLGPWNSDEIDKITGSLKLL